MRDWHFIVITDKGVTAELLDCIPKGISDADMEQLLKDWNLNDKLQQACYRNAVPKQYRMLFEASAVIIPLLKEKTDILHPENVSHLNGFASIWCCIENIFLAATAEGLGCNLRIPLGDESEHVREVLKYPDDYFMPCFIGIGKPLEGVAPVKQVEINPQDRIHWNKWCNMSDDITGSFEKKLETDRLILRRWKDSDADDLFKYASDPDVGPIAGWPAHQSIEESLEVIKNVFNGKEAYAICLKEDEKAIGAIELKLNGYTDLTERDDECELGYWLGKPFWGQGIMPEAVKELLRHAFEDCGMQKVWCGYFEGNNKSKRVQEKCGFKFQWKSENVDVPLMREKRIGHVNCMTKEEWQGLANN